MTVTPLTMGSRLATESMTNPTLASCFDTLLASPRVWPELYTETVTSFVVNVPLTS